MNVAPSSSSVLYPIDTVDDILAPLTPLGVHIVAVFAFLVGGTMLLFGRRFLKLCVFCTGFGVGFLLFACAADKLNETVSELGFAPHTILLIALVGGSLFGTLSALLVTVTKVVIAMGVAIGLAFIANTTGLSADASMDHAYVLWALIIIVFLIALWCAFKIFDHAMVIGTSLVGALSIIVSVAHFLPTLNVSLWAMFKDPSLVKGCAQQDAWNGCNEILMSWGVLVCLGLFVQFRQLDGCDRCGGSDDSASNRKESELVYTQL